MGDTCPTCNGTGVVISKESLFIQVCRELEQMQLNRTSQQIKLCLNIEPSIVEYFKERIHVLKKYGADNVEIQADRDIDRSDYRIVVE
jgi:ribonuclease G